jgi:DNA polymerase III epsilon subunit-like protein
MKDLPLAFIDLETTGVNPSIHEIIEIGVVRARQTGDPSDPLVEVDRFSMKITPEHLERADRKALQVNHFDVEVWRKEGVSFKDAFPILDEKLKGHILVAQNVAFDVGFLARAYEHLGKSLDNSIYYHKLDVASLAMGKEYWNEAYRRFSLHELSTNTGMKNANAHSALADAVVTFEIVRELLRRP